MSAARRVMDLAAKSGFRLRLHVGRIQLAPKAFAPVDLLKLLREHQEEIVFELSRFCTNCGSTHAPFGFGFDYRSPVKTKWFCFSCSKSFGQKKHSVEETGFQI